AHVPAADRGGEAKQLVEVLAQRHGTADVDERIRSDFLVDDYRRTRISAKVPALDRVAPGHEHQLLAVKREPHRHHVRLSAGPAGGELRRTRAVVEEGADLLRSHLAGHECGCGGEWRARTGGAQARLRHTL